MGQNGRDNSRWLGLVLAAATVAATAVAFCGFPALAQHTTGHLSGPVSAGHGVAIRPMGPVPGSHGVAVRPMAPGHSTGIPTHSGQRFGAMHANSLGVTPPPPSWELPRTVIPHWETSNIPIQPNPVRGNPIPRQRNGLGAAGVGYFGLPYYVDPTAFVNADNEGDQESETAQQAQPSAPARPDYAPQGQGPYGEGPEGAPSDQGYPPPARAPYNPEAYPSPAQNAAPPDNGLDHPAVTLVFNDGRPPMQVHSYVLTKSSVFVAEKGHQRVIPVTDLDLPATVAQNREAGVDFKLPGGNR